MNLKTLPIPPVTLDLGEYILRPLRPSDASAWYDYLSDPEVTRLTSYKIESIATVETMIADYITGYTQKTSTRWAIAHKDADVLIGTCGYYWWDAHDATAGLGYDLSRNHWGKNIMTVAVQAIVKWGFETLKTNQIQASVMVDNVGSKRVLEKNGFQLDGTLRNELKIAHGKPGIFWVFSLLRKDYQPLK
jgi:ribosomal-protein-alanine N-acetyltransferase